MHQYLLLPRFRSEKGYQTFVPDLDQFGCKMHIVFGRKQVFHLLHSFTLSGGSIIPSLVPALTKFEVGSYKFWQLYMSEAYIWKVGNRCDNINMIYIWKGQHSLLRTNQI